MTIDENTDLQKDLPLWQEFENETAERLANELVISEHDYDWLNAYDHRNNTNFVKYFEADPVYKAVATTNVPISEGGDFEAVKTGNQYFNWK
jgi:hypothetical protein|tara:strand:+ start:128 stop:403 length:276 start_codon:yes stop_codon:yes gene_type:complete